MTTKQTTAKRADIRSPEERARIAAAARRKVKPHKLAKLSAHETMQFDLIINELVRADLTPDKIYQVSMLAKYTALVISEAQQLALEGTVLTDPKGKEFKNPRASVVSQFQALVVQMRRSLGLHAKDQIDNASGRTAEAKRIEEEAGKGEDLFAGGLRLVG